MTSEVHCLVSSALEPQFCLLDLDRDYVVGRDLDVQIRLPSDRVSHKHARFFWQGSDLVNDLVVGRVLVAPGVLRCRLTDRR